MSSRCEDWPCCGHGVDQYGQPDCPDSEGRFKCVECGKRLPENANSSICPKCQRRMYKLIAQGTEPFDDRY